MPKTTPDAPACATTTPERVELLRAASHLLFGLGLSSHTEPIPRAQAQALDLSERLAALVSELEAEPDPRDGVALSQRVGRWPV